MIQLIYLALVFVKHGWPLISKDWVKTFDRQNTSISCSYYIFVLSSLLEHLYNLFKLVPLLVSIFPNCSSRLLMSLPKCLIGLHLTSELLIFAYQLSFKLLYLNRQLSMCFTCSNLISFLIQLIEHRDWVEVLFLNLFFCLVFYLNNLSFVSYVSGSFSWAFSNKIFLCRCEHL